MNQRALLIRRVCEGAAAVVMASVMAACGGGGEPAAHQEDAVTVPELAGSTQAFAETALVDLGLKPDVVAVELDGAVGTVSSLNPTAGERVMPGSVVVVRVVALAATTTTSTTTTTTLPEQVPGAAVDYFEEIARDNDASLKRAAAASVGLASTYAAYLAAAGQGVPGTYEEQQETVIICRDYEDGTSCFEFSNFVLSPEGKLAAFSIDGVPIKTVMWNPSALSDDELCLHYDDDPCNFEHPELDTNAYLLPSYAYRAAAGDLILVIEVISGQRNLDVLWDNSAERLRVTATDTGGNVTYPEIWWTTPDVATSSSLGLRVPKNSRTFMLLGFPGFGGDVDAVSIELLVDWGGRHTVEIDLPDLPDA